VINCLFGTSSIIFGNKSLELGILFKIVLNKIDSLSHFGQVVGEVEQNCFVEFFLLLSIYGDKLLIWTSGMILIYNNIKSCVSCKMASV
jgi:hypothetical protein